MAIPNRSTSDIGNSMKVPFNSLKPDLDGDLTQRIPTMPILPLRKVFKCGTAGLSKSKFQKNLEAVSSKDNLYLADQPTIKNVPHSSIDLQQLLEPQESSSNIKTLSKFELLMTESQKKKQKLCSIKFELEFPEETETREVLTEENAYKLLKRLFHSNYLLWPVKDQAIKEALPYIFLKKFKQMTTILSEGEIPYNFFIIQSGIVLKKSVQNGKVHTKYLDKGKMFGEKSLFDQTKRTSSYVSEGNCLLWGINIATFFKLLDNANRDNFNENRRIIDKVGVFKFISSLMKDRITLAVYEQRFQRGEVLLEPGSVCACCFLVKKGEILMKNAKNGVEKVYRPGDYIGDWSLNSFYFQSGLEAGEKDDVVVLVVSNKRLRSILGDNLYSLNWKNLSRIAFSQSSLFSRFPSETIEKLVNNVQICCYEKNQMIIKKAEPVESLYIILDGNLRKVSGESSEENKIIGEECSLFGESFLMKKSSLKRDESVIMDSNGIIGEISRTNIERIIGLKLADLTMTDSPAIFSPQIPLNPLSPPSISMADIEVLELVGEGQFGLVFLVRVRNEYFALKICAKSYIISRRFELYLINEKLIQSTYGEFPFLIQFNQSFKDDNLVCFLMEYVDGKDLSSIYYSGSEVFSCEVARFYTAQLILTVEYLHSKHIVHRDIKLNNILVDHLGFIKLIDFGIAKALLPGSRTFTIVGTPHYMAPEIILGKGYNYSVDYWAIGICLYEMLFGKLPFGDNTEDPIEVYSSILGAKQPVFEKGRILDLAYGTIDVILGLLNRDVGKRLGKGGKCKEIKEHSWFHGYDWEGVLSKKGKTFHAQKKKRLEGLKGKHLAVHLQEEGMQAYLKKEEKRLSMIQGWDDFF